MSGVRQSAHIDAPLAEIWELLGDPRRHPDWWPRVIEIEGECFDVGEEYAQVTRTPFGRSRTKMQIETRDELRQVRMTCQTTGLFSDWRLTEAAGGTFVDAEFGMEPHRISDRAFDRMLGPRYFRRWLAESLEALRAAATA